MRAVLFITVLMVAAAPAKADEWILTDAAEKRAAEMRAVKMRLSVLDCRGGASGSEFLMTWEENPEGTEWSWREADALTVRRYLREFRQQKFRLVTHKTFKSASGSERACALWHR